MCYNPISTLVQFGSQSLPAGEQTGLLRCGEKRVGDELQCGRDISVKAQEKIVYIMLAVKVLKLQFLPLKPQLLKASDCTRV